MQQSQPPLSPFRMGPGPCCGDQPMLQRVVAAFGQTAFGKKIRIWPGHFRDCIWPESVFQNFDRPNRIWPELVCFGQVCVCVCVVCVVLGVFCVQDFWWVSSRFLGLSARPPPLRGPLPPGVQGIVVGDVVRRLVARTVARHLGQIVVATTFPYQYTLSTVQYSFIKMGVK